MLFLVSLLVLQTARAESEIECAPDFPTRCAASIQSGDPAPFDGQVLTPDMAIFLGQSANACGERIAAEVARTSSTAKADRARDLAIVLADMRVVEVERDAYKRAASVPLIEKPVVVATITAVVMVALYFAASATVNAARPSQ